MAMMTLWHVIGEPEKSIPSPDPKIISQKKGGSDSFEIPGMREAPDTPAQSFRAEDDAMLHLVPGGTIDLPERFDPLSEERLEIAPFYMDETQVTNHQYVNFLNQVLPEISVEKGVVKGGGEIWLLLGEIVKGYEPIAFRKGKFRMNNSAHASHSVLRVTGYGASAYARHYGRRLPSAAEWFYAATEGTGKLKKQNEIGNAASNMTAANGMHDQMHPQLQTPDSRSETDSGMPFPVDQLEPNTFGIRGLAENIDEWGKLSPAFLSKADIPSDYAVLDISSLVTRHPWEAFEKVGFRCALGLSDAKR
jgi:serine/threonine-protein kinase